MSSHFAVNAAAARTLRNGMNRIALAVTSAVVMLAGSSVDAAAQEAPEHKPGWEFIVPSGAVVPTGAQRGAIKRGSLTAAQLSRVITPSFAVTATIGWARSRDVASAGDPKLDVFTYDVGAEMRAPRLIAGERMSFSPFAGVGAGGRSYNYRSLEVDATHNVAAYGSAGGELAIGRVRVRVEARDYVTGFKPLTGNGAADTRNDVALMAGLRIVSR
jgi:hypothetical protein